MRDLHGVVDGFALRRYAAGEQGVQAFAFEQLGDQEWRALVPADIVDGKNVGMAERGNGAGFLLEAAEMVGIGGERCRQNLGWDLSGC